MAAASGRLDVDAMLDQIEPRQFDEWVAWRRLNPDPVERIATILKLGLAASANAWGAAIEPDQLDPLNPTPDEAPDMSPEQMAAAVRGCVPQARKTRE